jgi:orotidine-5'-phosphate decarboxylase
MTFGAKLADAMASHGPLCVGIDPHVGLIDQWGMPDTPAGLEAFGMAVVEASAGLVGIVKPNIAFFERHGSAGIAALERVVGEARAAGLLVLMDAKRGDIGSTMQGYAEAFLARGAPLESDALTVSPYLGFGSLQPALELAESEGKGLFVLALTSNPEGRQVQHATTAEGVSVARAMVAAAAQKNAGAEPMGSIGLVVGATIGSAARDLGIDLAQLNGPLLSPGVGAQGAGPAEIAEVFGAARRFVLVSQSRGVLTAGPDVESMRTAIRRATVQASEALSSSPKF